MIAILKLNTKRDAKPWKALILTANLGVITKRIYDRHRNNTIEKIPRIERSRMGVIWPYFTLNDCIVSILIKKVDLGHIEYKVHILINCWPVVASDLGDKRIFTGI